MTGSRASVASAQVDGPGLRVYGRAGSFGGLQGAETTPSGDRVAAVPVRNWGFLPGQAAYFPAVAPDGTVVIANEPQTDDQMRPTARQMVLSTFSPATGRFANVVIPTSRGKTTLGGPWSAPSMLTGGADVSDLGVIRGPQGPQVTFLSAMPFWGWNADRAGEFPTLGVLRAGRAGAWSADPRRSTYASTIAQGARRAAAARATHRHRRDRDHRAGGPSSAALRAREQACVLRRYPATSTYGDCRMPAEFDQLPRSGALIVAQYGFDDPARPSGRITALSTAGAVLASLPYPAVRLPDGTPVRVHPREVVSDPLGVAGDERFVIVFDVEQEDGRAGPAAAPGVLQEFSFDATASTLRATSAPVRTGDRWGDQTLGIELARYSADGTLWVGQSLIGTLQAGPLAVYRRGAGARGVLGDHAGCAPGSSAGADWGRACPPDARVAEAAPLGIARSLDEDVARGRMLLTTMSGFVLPIASPGAAQEPVAGRPLNLGLDQLVDRTMQRIGPRKAALDPGRGSLWIPIQQLATDRTCAAWPCPPQALDQWLVEVDLRRLG